MPHAGDGLQGEQAVWRGRIFPNAELRVYPSQDVSRTVNVTGRALADTHQVASRRAKLEEVVERRDPVDPAERKAECAGGILEPLLGEIAIMVLHLLQDGHQSIGLAAIALQDSSQLRWWRGKKGITLIDVPAQGCRLLRAHGLCLSFPYFASCGCRRSVTSVSVVSPDTMRSELISPSGV